MTQEDSLNLFLQKFDCAFNQAKLIRAIPINSLDYWNLKCKRATIELLPAGPGYYINPLSFMLEGTKICKRMFGERKNYDEYLLNRYPFYNLESTYALDTNLLYDYFCAGYIGSPKRNNELQDIRGLASNLGSFIANRYFGCGIHLHQTRNWFK